MVEDQEQTAEQKLSDGIRLMRAAYYTHIRDLSASVIDELRDRIKEGEGGESLREWLIEHINEDVDGDAWVIYTFKSQVVCLASDNDGAYVDDFGEEGLVKDGSINWSGLAYCAIQRDLMEQLDAEGVDVNDPENSDAFEELRTELAARAACADLTREQIVKALTGASIECRDDETDDVLREALVQNIIDGTIDESDIE